MCLGCRCRRSGRGGRWWGGGVRGGVRVRGCAARARRSVRHLSDPQVRWGCWRV